MPGVAKRRVGERASGPAGGPRQTTAGAARLVASWSEDVEPYQNQITVVKPMPAEPAVWKVLIAPPSPPPTHPSSLPLHASAYPRAHGARTSALQARLEANVVISGVKNEAHESSRPTPPLLPTRWGRGPRRATDASVPLPPSAAPQGRA